MSDANDPFSFDAEYGDPDFVRSARDPNRPPQPGKEWEHKGRATDAEIEPGGEPSPFADLDDGPSPEDEPYSNSDIDTRKVTVTFIKDKTGAEMRRVDMTLPQLAEHIRFQTAASKMGLPWLKLAFFGNKRSQKNSLRTNENVLQITGIEVEHDSSEIAFSTALAAILKARIRCIIYTSPSYVPGDQGALAHSGAAVAEPRARGAREVRRARQRLVRRQARARELRVVAGVSVRQRQRQPRPPRRSNRRRLPRSAR